MIKYAQDYYEEYMALMRDDTDQEIVDAFNKQVGNPGWVTARAGYLAAIRKQLNERGMDYSEIGDKTVMSYRYCVVLEGKTLIKLGSLTLKDISLLFLRYMKHQHLDSLSFNPIVIDFNDIELRYRMDKHNGEFLIQTNALIKELQ